MNKERKLRLYELQILQFYEGIRDKIYPNETYFFRCIYKELNLETYEQRLIKSVYTNLTHLGTALDYIKIWFDRNTGLMPRKLCKKYNCSNEVLQRKIKKVEDDYAIALESDIIVGEKALISFVEFIRSLFVICFKSESPKSSELGLIFLLERCSKEFIKDLLEIVAGCTKVYSKEKMELLKENIDIIDVNELSVYDINIAIDRYNHNVDIQHLMAYQNVPKATFYRRIKKVDEHDYKSILIPEALEYNHIILQELYELLDNCIMEGYW